MEALLHAMEGVRADARQQHLAAAMTWADRAQLPKLALLQHPGINDQVLIRSVRIPITSP